MLDEGSLINDLFVHVAKALAAKQTITDLGNMAAPPSRTIVWENGPSFALVNRTRRLLHRPRC